MSEVALTSDFLGAFGVLERDGAVLLAANERQLTPGAAPELVYDLPGGRVEAGETLAEALVREWEEECRITAQCREMLFVQEGTRVIDGSRRYCWRSFFFRVATDAQPLPGGEIDSLLWAPRDRLTALLTAPYHSGFLRWLADGRTLQQDCW